MTPNNSHYITTPIYYISGNPHIGHAYTTIAADTWARFHRARNPEHTRMLTGTDEHGQKVAHAAAEAGLSPHAWTDRLVPKWKELLERYDIRTDDFIRTTEERHIRTCEAVFEKLCERETPKGRKAIYRGTYEGWYCANDETFWLESKLIDGHCPNPECRREVQWLSEENWFFALADYQDELLKHFRANPTWVRPERSYNEMIVTLEAGLEDLCISRLNLDWGVPLPGGGVMYVWLDALLNYISALGYAQNDPLFERFWPASVHVIGKEIARFHTIIWPAVLMALGLELPKLVFAHGWITIEGEKMSKSLGNVVDPFALADRFGADTVRYFLLREAPFGSDFSFSEEKVRQRRNSDLANDLGNLVKRSLAMLAKYRDGIVPQSTDTTFGQRVAQFGLLSRVDRGVRSLNFRDALDAIWELVSALNRLIDERKPWELHKQEKTDELDTVLADLCDGLHWLAMLLAPFMPATARSIWHQLGLDGEPQSWNQVRGGAGQDQADGKFWRRLASGTKTQPAQAPLFPRLELEPVSG